MKVGVILIWILCRRMSTLLTGGYRAALPGLDAEALFLSRAQALLLLREIIMRPDINCNQRIGAYQVDGCRNTLRFC